MSRRRGLTEEERTLLFIEGATAEELARLIDRAQLVGRVRYAPNQELDRAKTVRRRGPGKKAPGAADSAGTGATAQ